MLCIRFYITLSIDLPTELRRDIGLYFLTSDLLYFLCIEVTLACFQTLGTTKVKRKLSKILVTDADIISAYSLK